MRRFPYMISFCIPVYNISFNLLKACFQSIIEQNCEEYEIICCEDCSTDESYSNLMKLAEEYPLKILRNEKNLGVSATRNKCIISAKGDYLWFVDPDDVLVENAAESIISNITDGADVVLGDYIRVAYDFRPDNIVSKEIPIGRRIETIGSNWYPTDSQGKKMCGVWGGVFRKKFLLENNIFFREGMSFAEDRIFFYEVSQFNPIVIKLNYPVYYYRQRPQSYMHQRLDKRSITEYDSLKKALAVYRSYENSMRDRKPKETAERIRGHRIACVRCLAMIPDESFVRNELDYLKRQGDYPVQSLLKIANILKHPKIGFDYLIQSESGFWRTRKFMKLIGII